MILAGYAPSTAEESADVSRIRDTLVDGDPWSRATAMHFTASALIVHPPTRRVLLRWHARQQAWIQVGGHADPGETDPLEVALREGREETGLEDLKPLPGSDLVHVVVVSVPAAPHEPAHEHADLRYVLSTESPEEIRPEKPGAELRWLTFPEAHALTGEPNVRETLSRVEALLS
ncbi:NUDIX hydrolase [Nonomuraea sediminis]|uniref:NUDIX hydrolase n=1 Tax=Nonomuraea sediminis TaxID=2835864 RepID=UPI001BDC96F8|nr:NUDIX domain-containing protein [Nonomuraea sediminis]